MCKFFALLCSLSTALFAFDGKEFDNTPSVLEYQTFLQEAVQDQDWWAAIDYAHIISAHFPKSPFASEAPYLMGEAAFHLGELELANSYFTDYLSHSASPKHFEDSIRYKFEIAEQFRNGVKKPLFGSHKLPKIVSAEEDAVAIYDDVITALPHEEIAAQALLGKALIQSKMEEYKQNLETLDLLIRRFPKHDLAITGFLEKSRTYLLQCTGKSFDPALLDLAELNIRKFQQAFPREERIAEAEKNVAAMREIFASHFMEIGHFFEKTKKTPAAILYYTKVVSNYPHTKAAICANQKLETLGAAQKHTETTARTGV